MIELRDISKSYVQGERTVSVLQGANLLVRSGDFLVLTAPSGSGKSTLLNIAGCLDQPDSGSVHLGNQCVTGLSDVELSKLRRERIGFIFQTFHLVPVLTACENVAYPLALQGIGRVERKERALELLAQVGLKDHAHKRPKQLSGGQRQRVAIARALVADPDIVFADEPTANLDETTALEIIDLLAWFNDEQDATLLVSTHDQRVADRAKTRVTLNAGRVMEMSDA